MSPVWFHFLARVMHPRAMNTKQASAVIGEAETRETRERRERRTRERMVEVKK